MITKDDVLELKDWFKEYTDTFRGNDRLIQRNYDLKIVHTYNVCINIIEIGKSIGLNEFDLNISEVIGLLHDLGRFDQFLKYNTFADNRSINHSILAIKIINENNLLEKFDENIKEIIQKAILNHNKININDEADNKILLFSKLIRDADKLDIYRIVKDYYSNKNEEKNNTIELELKDSIEYSQDIYNTVLAKNVVRYEDLRFLNDFKLLQLSWIYDINFLFTFKMIRKKDYLTYIYNSIPESEKIKELYNRIKLFLNKKIIITENKVKIN